MKKREASLRKTNSLISLKSALIVSCSSFFVSSCAITHGEREIQNSRFEFALIGDMPYMT